MLLTWVLTRWLCLQAATQAVVATQRLVSPEKRLSRLLGQVSPQDEVPPGPPRPLSHEDRPDLPDRPGRC